VRALADAQPSSSSTPRFCAEITMESAARSRPSERLDVGVTIFFVLSPLPALPPVVRAPGCWEPRSAPAAYGCRRLLRIVPPTSR
jgi:peptidoglycan/LPS O-acetylase OafA/YrhL